MSCPADIKDCPHALRSAEIAVKRVFAIMGVDIDKPKDVQEFQQNLQFGATMRTAVDRGLLAVVVVVAGGVCAAVWAGIVAAVHK
jgi:uncharacterized protein (DUF697 family)